MNQKAGDAAVAQITTEFGKDRAMFIKCDVTKHKDMEGKPVFKIPSVIFMNNN